jgi:hypothetical protein
MRARLADRHFGNSFDHPIEIRLADGVDLRVGRRMQKSIATGRRRGWRTRRRSKS